METTRHVNFDKYAEFVDAVTSDASKDFLALSDRLVQLDEKGANIERLLTGAVGAAAESGELLEVVKKLIFQGKSWNALDTPLDEIIKMNVEKLLKRYPEGYFDAFYSENREKGDI